MDLLCLCELNTAHVLHVTSFLKITYKGRLYLQTMFLCCFHVKKNISKVAVNIIDMNSRRGVHGMMSLHVAALYGHLDCVRKLLSVMPGIDLNVPDDCGRTCLHAAACSG